VLLVIRPAWPTLAEGPLTVLFLRRQEFPAGSLEVAEPPLDDGATAGMLAWETSGFSVDASVLITLIDRDVPSYFRAWNSSCGTVHVRPSR
jgi:hypothetical protein